MFFAYTIKSPRLAIQKLLLASYFIVVLVQVFLLGCGCCSGLHPTGSMHPSLRPAQLSVFVLQSTDSTERKVIVFLITTEKWGYFWLATSVPSGFRSGASSIQQVHTCINDQNGRGEHTTPKFAGGNRLGELLTLLRDKMPCRGMQIHWSIRQ